MFFKCLPIISRVNRFVGLNYRSLTMNTQRLFLVLFIKFRAPLKFGRPVHCALRRKMRKLPITRASAILKGLKNRLSWKTDSFCTEIVKWHRHGHEWLHLGSIQNSNEENGRSSQFLLVSECISVFRVIRCLKVGRYLSNRGITYLLKSAPNRWPAWRERNALNTGIILYLMHGRFMDDISVNKS